jgi:hypothetical protein
MCASFFGADPAAEKRAITTSKSPLCQPFFRRRAAPDAALNAVDNRPQTG